MSKFEVIELSRFEKRRRTDMFGYQATQAFSIAFVYSDKGNFVVKGMSQAVESYIPNYYPNSIYYISFWNNGKSRGYWRSTRNIYISLRELAGRYKYSIMIFRDGKLFQEMNVRRVPHKWLDAFNKADAKTSKRE